VKGGSWNFTLCSPRLSEGCLLMKYALKRAAAGLATMLIVSFLTYAAFDLISDAATAMLGTSATPERLAALRAELGLDRPLMVRYGEWLLGFFTGDLGVSQSYRQPVWDLIAPKAGLTLCLSLLSFALITAVSIPLGLLTAGRRRFEGARTALNQLGMAVPPFFTGILLSWVFGVGLKWFTPGQFPEAGTAPAGAAVDRLFAAVALSIPRIAMTARMLRGTVREELERDYVRTAISRGNDRSQVLRRHVLKNALPPVVTFLAQTMAELVAGRIVVEQVFVIPGLGRMLVTSIAGRDYPVVQAIVVILAFWVVLAGTAADVTNARIDPRLRLGGAA